jgi:hypothetical protein
MSNGKNSAANSKSWKSPNVFWHDSGERRLQLRSDGEHARQELRRRPLGSAEAEAVRKRPAFSISEASLKAVQAHSEGATPAELLNYLSREFGMTVRPNHLGAALQRHRRAGQLENRDQRWYLPS